MSSLFDAQHLEDALQDRLRQHTERYHKYQLEKNPFPLGGNYPDAYLDYTYYEDAKKGRIRDFLVSTFVREEFNGLIVLGEYGSGKSHVLHYIRSTVNSDPFFGKQAQCFLIQNPSISPEDILLSMLREVKLSVVQDLIFKPVLEALKEKYLDSLVQFLVDFTDFNPQLRFDDVEYSPPSHRDIFFLSHREFLKNLSDRKIKLNQKKLQSFARDVLLKQLTLGSDVLANDLAQLITADDTSRSWETFLSSRLMSAKMSLGVEHYLQAFLELFKASGVRHVYLLVDEVEDLRTQRMNTKATVEYLATLRKLIQHNYKMFSFVLACTRDAWGDLRKLYPAIEDRFPIKLDLLPNKSEVKRIVLRYLEEARRQDGQTSDQWMPFTEKAIEAVIEGRGLVLRHVLTELRSVLDIAVNLDVTTPINEEFIKNNLSLSS